MSKDGTIFKKFFAFFPTRITPRQAKDTGMAMVLICLLVGQFWDHPNLFVVAIPLLVIDMIFPLLYRPVATVWLGLSTILGTIMSRVILTIIFFILVTPIGLIRRAFGKDTLKLKKWKQGEHSVFQSRDCLFKSEEIEKPY
jgi:hypothetical protein